MATTTPAAPVEEPLPEEGVGPAGIRRLSREEIGNSIQALLGVRPAALSQLPADKQDHAFDRVAQSQTVTGSHVEAFGAVADELAQALTPDRLAAVAPGCPGGAQPADSAAVAAERRGCIEKLIDTVGPRAFRKPLDPAKKTALLGLYDAAGSYTDGLRLVLHGLFAAPDFLYVVETGQAVPGKPGVFALTDHEIAARLSFFICETVPDGPLFAAANEGKLNQPDQIAAHAERLFDQPCARRTITRFFLQWLDVEKVAGLVRDPLAFPAWNDAVRAAMLKETESFVQHVVWEGKGALRDLFTATYSFVNKDLAPIYGVTVGSADPQKVDIPAERRGLLTQPAVLAATAHQKDTSPVQRGVYVLRRLLCQELPPPPPSLMIKPPAEDHSKTTRSRWEKHSSDPVCSGCHQIIDPVGFSMENFDPIGRHRTSENNLPIDSVGGIPSLGVPRGKVTGGAELSLAVAETKELTECFARQWLRFGLGRMDASADARAVAEMSRLARASTLRSMMTGLSKTYAFRHRAVGTP